VTYKSWTLDWEEYWNHKPLSGPLTPEVYAYFLVRFVLFELCQLFHSAVTITVLTAWSVIWFKYKFKNFKNRKIIQMYSWLGDFVSYTVSWRGKADGSIADMGRMFNSCAFYCLVAVDTKIVSHMPFSR
jgi:hypothetical protein